MRNIVIPILSLLSITAVGQQQAVINNYDSAYLKNELFGWWKFTGNQNKSAILSDNTLLFTPTEILFYSGDSITRKTTYTLTTVSYPKSMNNTANVLLHLADRGETWFILFFISGKKPNAIIINTEPGCFCDCPFEVYGRLIDAGFAHHKKPQ